MAFVILITAAGTSAVLLAVVMMNRITERPSSPEPIRTVSFSVVRPSEEPRSALRRAVPTGEAGTAMASDNALSRERGETALPAPDAAGGTPLIVASAAAIAPWNGAAEVASSVADLSRIVLTDESVDERPSVESGPLAYPEAARRRGIEGKVTVKALVDAEGRVKTVKLLDAQPPGFFEEAVLRSLPGWRFRPAMYRGRAISVWATIPIVFSLQ